VVMYNVSTKVFNTNLKMSITFVMAPRFEAAVTVW